MGGVWGESIAFYILISFYRQGTIGMSTNSVISRNRLGGILRVLKRNRRHMTLPKRLGSHEKWEFCVNGRGKIGTSEMGVVCE